MLFCQKLRSELDTRIGRCDVVKFFGIPLTEGQTGRLCLLAVSIGPENGLLLRFFHEECRGRVSHVLKHHLLTAVDWRIHLGPGATERGLSPGQDQGHVGSAAAGAPIWYNL